MLTVFYNSCRGSLSNKSKFSYVILRKYASQTAALQIPVTENKAEEKPKLIIQCKHESLNFYAGQNYAKFQAVPLASKGWRHHKSINDHFILYPDGNTNDASNDVEITSFSQSGLNRRLIKNLEEHDLIKPSQIQSIAIPVILSGKNSIIAAETGCGKTLAYLLPLLEQINKWKKLSKRNCNEPLGLILSPSRDLTHQLGMVAKKIAKDMDIDIRIVVGGRTKKQMINPRVDDVDLLIGSFGAVSKLTTTHIFNMSSVRHVVLEEADTLLDDSFTEKLRHFLRKIKFSFAGSELNDELPNSSQLTLVSATMPTYLPEVLDEIANSESLVRLTTDKLHRIMPQVTQKFIRIDRASKAASILKIAKESVAKKRQIIIFCNTIKTCQWLYLFLNEFGIDCGVTHGDIPADIRLDKFAAFQRGHFKVLITTDACSRGLDTVQVNHIVNFDFPLYTSDYIHRCGRTGRLGNNERCLVTNLIVHDREVELLQKIEKSVRTSAPLPDVNGNITKVINTKIRKELHDTQSLINENNASQLLKF